MSKNLISKVGPCLALVFTSALYGLDVNVTDSLPGGDWHFTEVTVPSDAEGWRIVVSSANGSPRLYVREGEDPTTSANDATGVAYQEGGTDYTETVTLAAEDLVEGTWHIGVRNTTGTALEFTLKAEEAPAVRTLEWDSGESDVGLAAFSVDAGIGGLYYFTTTTQNTEHGVWRQALRMEEGQGQLFYRANSPATPSSNDRASELSDLGGGFVEPLGTSGVTPNTRHLTVATTPGSSWSVVAGDVHVVDLGSLAADDSSGSHAYDTDNPESESSRIPVEGVRFFRTSIPVDTLAWRLWVQGSDGNGTEPLEVRVRTGQVPSPANNATWTAFGANHDRDFVGQSLLVPPYLDAGGGATYFVALLGDAGETFRFDSRQQPIEYINFDETVGPHGGDGAWFQTFQLNVPSDVIGWEVTSLQISGDPFIAVRRDAVPNASENDAYSEVVGGVENSITLVPPDLNDGTYLITVYGEDDFTFELRNRAPEVSGIDYASTTENTDTDRVGWRYFVITDIESQLGTLGWLLELDNASANTRVAIRRNALPGSRNYRQNGNDNDQERWDDIGPADFLQSPDHQADVWYVGVYSESHPLGGFTLNSGSITAATYPMDGTSINYNGLRPGEWTFFRFDVPEQLNDEDYLGWELRVLNLGQGLPTTVLQRSSLPAETFSSLNPWGRATEWSSNARMVSWGDWTGRSQSADGSISQEINMLSFGMGQPLEPGTYYLGLLASQFGDPLDFRLESRAVGEAGSGLSYEVEALSFEGGSATGTLDPRSVAYYKVEIPEGTPNWRVRLDVEAGDEAELFIRKDHLPNRVTSSQSNADPARPLLSRYPDNIQGSNVDGYQVGLDSDGGERFDLWPRGGASNTTLEPGTYYLMVVSAGSEPSANNRIGGGPIEYTLVSEGEIPVEALGLLADSEASLTASYDPGSYTYFTFELPEDLLAVEIRLEGTEGNPYMRLRQDGIPPAAHRILNAGSSQQNIYGHFNGRVSQWDDPDVIYLTNPDAGVYALTVGERITSQMEAGNFSLTVSPVVPQVATFDGFSDTVTDLGPGEWQYYEVTVPETLNGEPVLGWEVRVTEWSGGTRPYIMIRREMLPSDPNANFNPGGTITWSPTSSNNSVMKNLEDWTGRNFPFEGSGNVEQYLSSLPMGQPLAPGKYYIGFRGVSTAQSTTFSWTTTAISESGSGAGYEVALLDFEGGTASGTLEPRAVAYYAVDVPENTRSWQIELNFDDPEDEGRLFLRKDFIPNSHAATNTGTANPTTPTSGNGMQVRLSKEGGEHFVLWPVNGDDYIQAGRYFLMVVSEGKNPPASNRIGEGSVSYELISHGEAEIVDLGVLPSAGDVVQSGSYDEGMQSYYHFEVPEGLLGLELRLEDRDGEPRMNLRAGEWPTSVPNGYGAYSGHTSNSTRHNELITMSSPEPGIYTMMITHASGTTTNPGVEAGSYTLRISSVGATDISIDGFTDTVEDLPASEWTYYRVEVPDELNGYDLLAWELSVTDWSGDEPPAIVIQKGSVPTSVSPSGSISTQGGRTNMNEGDRIVISDTSPLSLWTDWSKRPFSADGTQEFERITHNIPMGQPLDAGEYYVGFRSRIAGQAPLSFTWESRAVTLEGSGVSHEVRELELDGSQSGTLQAREIQHYFVDIPEETKSWQIELEADAGEEVRMHIRGIHMVNTMTSSNAFSNPANWNGSGGSNNATSVHMTHSGKQRFVLWPEYSDEYLLPGRYYITVVGLGQSPSAEDRVGTGPVHYTLRSLPEADVQNLGTLPLAGQLLQEDASYAAGEIHYYRFEVPEGTLAVEALIRDRTGTPGMALIPGEYGPRLTYGSTSFPLGSHGQYSGKSLGVLRSDQLLTLTNPEPGIYTLAVAHLDTPGYGAGGYTLEIHSVEPTTLHFGQGGNTGSGQLAVGQSDFYQVDVDLSPTSSPEPGEEGEAVLGWRLRLYDNSGEAEMRVRFGSLPQGTSNSDQSSIEGKSALIVPPFLEEGDWYIEVRGVTASNYTLESVPVTLSTLQRTPWIMPERGEPSVTPGLSGAQIGDTGVDANGDPLPGDQGIDLSNGDFHLYAVEVPEENGGLFRTVLESISGDSDLYIRAGALPSYTHGSNNLASGTLADHRMTGSDITEYGAWVPYHVLEEDTLTPGLWFLKVRADGDTNARYRLRLSHNADTLVQDLPLGGGTYENQTLAGTDWRYYRVTFPDNPEDIPEEWILSFSEAQGSVDMYIRDTAPPGMSETTTMSSSTSYFNPRDWSNNNVWRSALPRRFTTAGTHVIEGIHLRPGKTYYVGFRANQDSLFSVTSTVGGQTLGELYGQVLLIANDGGYTETTLQPGERISWAVDVPKDTPRWRHLAWHDAEVELTVTRNFLPNPDGSGNYHNSSGDADSGRDSNLFSSDRGRNQTFYVSMINNSAEEQPVALLVDLREEGAFEIDFTIVGEGTVETDPELYATGETIEVTAIPDPGWSFVGWSGDLDSTDNPVTVTPMSAFALTATFEAMDTGMVSDAQILTEQLLVRDGAGDPLEIEVTLTNPESTAETFTPVLNIDNGEQSWQISLAPVTVAADATETITLSYDLSGVYPSSSYSSEYAVSVNDFPAGSFSGIYLEARAYWSDSGYGEIEIGDYEEIGYRIYSLPDEAIALDIEIRANGTLIHSETANVAAGASATWTDFVWYATEPGEYEIRINDILAVGSPVIFYDPDAPDPGDPDPEGEVVISGTSVTGNLAPGETISFNVDLEETTGDASADLTLDFSIDSELQGSETISLSAGESTGLVERFTHVFAEAGTYNWSINEISGQVVIENPVINVEIEHLNVSRETVYSGHFVRVEAEVTNLDDFEGEHEVNFTVRDLIGGPLSDGPVEIFTESRSVTLDANDTITVAFHYLIEFEGSFDFAIGELDPLPVDSVSAWAQRGKGHGNINSGSIEAPMFNIASKWTYAAGDESFHYVRSTPVVVDGVVYVGSWPPALHALDAETGELVWDEPFETDSAVTTSPAFADGRVFVTTGGAGGTTLHSVNASDGAELWNASDLGDTDLTAPLVVDDLVYVGSDSGLVRAFQVEDGAEAWSYDMGAEVHATPAYANGILYVASDSEVSALDALTGETVWDAPVALPFVRAGLVVVQNPVSGEWVVIASSMTGSVQALDAHTGAALWAEAYDAEAMIEASPAVAGQSLYIVTSEGTVHQLDLTTGEATGWDAPFEADGGIVGSPVYANSRIHFATTEGTLYAVPGFVAEPQPVWTYAVGAPSHGSLAIFDGVIYLGDNDANVHALESGGEDPGPILPDAPEILTHPVSQEVAEGNVATFTVEADGEGALVYQWFKDGSAISGADEASFTIASLAPEDGGNYHVEVENEGGSVVSDAAVLTVLELPRIVSFSPSAEVVEGGSVSFTVQATGAEPLSYEWRKDGSLMDGVSGSTLSITGVSANNIGSYTVTVSNALGSVQSNARNLNVLLRPRIVSGPQDQSAAVGESVTFSVNASGDGDLTYRWSLDGVSLTAFTEDASFTVPSVGTADAGVYRVEVSSEYGQIDATATLTVSLPAALPTPFSPVESTDDPNYFISQWFGGILIGDDFNGWVFSDAHGWINVWPGQPEGMLWFYHLGMLETLYTANTDHPAIFSYTHGWLYYAPDPEHENIAWYYRYDDETWFWVEV